MGNKSGIADQVISVPKGGGALQGIGETFKPDLFTGTGNFSLPIALPPGRNRLQPQLNLVYSTGSGNGPFGLGWGIDVPDVTRKTSKGIPQYRDLFPDPQDHDTFILSGAEDLVATRPRTNGVTRFRPRTEGLFARIEHVLNGDAQYWRVRGKDGLTSLYGRVAQHDEPAVIADPAVRSKIFCWKLSETSDTFGNRISYNYFRDAPVTGLRRWDQLYLERIEYVDIDTPTGTRFLVSVSFLYDEARPDPFSSYRAGFEIRTRFRCRRIEVRTHADEDILIRTYDLTYLDQILPESALPDNRVSLLSEIRVVGHDTDGTEELPPLSFTYTPFQIADRRFEPLAACGGGILPQQSLAAHEFETVDLSGYGLPDIVAVSGRVSAWRNKGGGHFDGPHLMENGPKSVSLAEPGVCLADMNGNGRADILALNRSGYFPLRFDGEFLDAAFVPYATVPLLKLEEGETRLMDLDGDGVIDALRTGSSFELFFNDPKTGFGLPETRARRPFDEFPNLNFSDARVKLGDMSGDGLQDFVLIENGNVQYWPYLGYGRWGRRIEMGNSPVFNDPLSSVLRFDPKRLHLSDVDGDGLADLVYIDVARSRILVWINRGGNSWSNPRVVEGLPELSNPDGVRVADMLGNGTAGILWTEDRSPSSQDTYLFLDLTGGVKPYLLTEMNNNMGAVTRVQYASSTKFYLADQAEKLPEWKTRLPFPVQVVECVEVIDELSGGKLTTRYRYHHGYWNGDEREFRGFGMVEHLDSQSFENFNAVGLHGTGQPFARIGADCFSSPTLTKTWRHLGDIDDETLDDATRFPELDFVEEFFKDDQPLLVRPPEQADLLGSLKPKLQREALRSLRGTVLRTELYAADDNLRPYTVTENLTGIAEIDKPEDPESKRKRVFFPHPVAQRTTQWERGHEPMTRFTFTSGYDTYGRPRAQTSVAVPRGRDFSRQVAAGGPSPAPYLATRAVTDYAMRDDADRYLVDRVARLTTYEMRNDGRGSLEQILASAEQGAFELPANIIGQTINFYDGEPFRGLPFQELGEHGALVRTESLVLTPGLIAKAYEQAPQPPGVAAKPPFFAPANHVPWDAWGEEYPQGFRTSVPANSGQDPTRPGLMITPLGYGIADGQTAPYIQGHYAATVRRTYTLRGLVGGERDALGHQTDISYDAWQLLPTMVKEPAGLVTLSENDYRVLAPWLITGPNGNRTRFAFSPLGLLAATWVMGKEGEAAGDTPDKPSTRLEYNFLAFRQSQQPVSVRTIRRIHHAHDPDVPAAEIDETITTAEYSDGFGRLLQVRTQGEEVRFGDAMFGGDVLPVDQDNLQTTSRDLLGIRNDNPANPNVIVSGWQVYDNKGRVIEKYEPFFSEGWSYCPAVENERGRKICMQYDPLGRVIQTLNPDGSQQREVHGIPLALGDPAVFDPTPWETYTYDANDNAGRTHPDQAGRYRHHWDTPSNIVADALGRTVETVQRNRQKPDAPFEEYRTRSTYDIRGNLIAVRDPLGRLVFQYVYDLASQRLHSDSLDAGIRRIILDAEGNVVELRDSKGALALHAYDRLSRLVRLWARDDVTAAATLREWLIYGDSPDAGEVGLKPEAARAGNLLGRLFQHYDEAGVAAIETYDFKDNVLEKVRRVIKDEQILSIFSGPGDTGQIIAFRVDWEPPAGASLPDHAAALLDATEYRTSSRLDALNRLRVVDYPKDVEDRRWQMRPRYNRAGALERVSLDDDTFVERIAYNAKGQRTLIVYGNGLMTRYSHDPDTFRLARLRTERAEALPAGASGYRLTDPALPLQDFAYVYDLAGNILQIVDRTPGCGVSDNAPESEFLALAGLLAKGDALVRFFEYDSLYRLTAATGRECKAITSPRPWSDDQHWGYGSGNHGTPNQENAPEMTAFYREQYSYDPASNILTMAHQAKTNAWTRRFGMGGLMPEAWAAAWPAHSGAEWADPPTNRLTHVGENGPVVPQTHHYDASGNMVRETASRHFDWDYADRMKAFRVQPEGAEPSVHVQYFYDAAGQRMKKLIRKGLSYAVTIYVDAIFEHHRIFDADGIHENNEIHVMDGQSRIAVVRAGEPLPGDGAAEVRTKYYLSDHLGSSVVVVGADARWINREEYFPYGETSIGSFRRKRYRYTGNERDDESGLAYHIARYYMPWIARWITVDPSAAANGSSAYVYAGCRPLIMADQLGMQAAPIEIPTETFWIREKAPERVPLDAETWEAFYLLRISYDEQMLQLAWAQEAQRVSGFIKDVAARTAPWEPVLTVGAAVVAAAGLAMAESALGVGTLAGTAGRITGATGSAGILSRLPESIVTRLSAAKAKLANDVLSFIIRASSYSSLSEAKAAVQADKINIFPSTLVPVLRSMLGKMGIKIQWGVSASTLGNKLAEYQPSTRTVLLRSEASVVDVLHEFMHAIQQMNTQGHTPSGQTRAWWMWEIDVRSAILEMSQAFPKLGITYTQQDEMFRWINAAREAIKKLPQ